MVPLSGCFAGNGVKGKFSQADIDAIIAYLRTLK
jgi:hypothetical protein